MQSGLIGIFPVVQEHFIAIAECPLENTRVLTGLMYIDRKRKIGEKKKEIN